MRNVAALTQREFSSILYSPVAYLTGFGFLLLTGVLFTYTTLIPGNDSTVQPMFAAMATVFVLCVPVLTMRVLADEYATGTIEALMTAPVTDLEVVVSKFLGVFMFYCLMLALTLIHLVVIGLFGKVDAGMTAVAYLGMLLLGGLYVAVGVFASACTRFQLLGALIGIGVLSGLTFLADYLSLQFPGARGVLGYLNVLGQFETFSGGQFDTRGLVYFLSLTAFFLFLAIKVVESKRWR